MTMTEMLALGAPVLPSGYFYRIGYAGFGYHKVSIRKQKRFGSKEISSCNFHLDDHGSATPEECIRAAAEMSVERWEAKQVSMARYKDLDKWMGDHK